MEGLRNHFSIWLFLWSNLVVKYRRLEPKDFKIRSIEENYDLETLWKEIGYEDQNLLSNGRNQEGVKVGDQRMRTQEALKRLRATLKHAHPFARFR